MGKNGAIGAVGVGCRFTPDEQSIFDGYILSDGHLEDCKGNSRLVMCQKHRLFIDYIKSSLQTIKWGKTKDIEIYDKRTKKTYGQSRSKSLSSVLMSKERKRWYPDGKKIVPRDIVLDDLCILFWYLGDGCLCKKKDRPNHRRICFATIGFEDEDIQHLLLLLKERIGNDSVYLENRNIYVGRQSLCKLVSVLGGTSPVVDYQYKFDFGRYFDSDYLQKSYEDRPLVFINEFRKKNRVRELNFISKDNIRVKEICND